MTQITCSTGCKGDVCYGVVRDGKLLRLSFSKSLCRHICSLVPDTQVAKVRLRLGRELAEGEASRSRLYAVCKTTDWPLRVTLFGQLSDRWRHPTRRVRECWVMEVVND